METGLGCILLVATGLLGLALSRYPGRNSIDALGFSVFPADEASKWADAAAHLGSTTALIMGVLVLSVGSMLARDWIRAVTSVLGPVIAVLAVDYLFKPIVARPFENTMELTYPSGTVAVVAALATGALLVAPRIVKAPVAVLGGATTAAVAAAMLTLRWHYATDVAGGVFVGAGAVLALDGSLLWCWGRFDRQRAQEI